MRIAVPHNTTRDMARKRVEQKVGQLLSQFGDKADDVRHEWSGDSMAFSGKARGMSVHGTLEVTDAAVILDGKLPLLARPFEGRIREAIERELAAMFA
jgi:hypothetical protein